MKKASIFIIFLVAFIDLLGFGIIIPIAPFYIKQFGIAEADVGKYFSGLMFAFAAMQFAFAPVWGRISDRIGRRPVLMISLAGSGITHLAFGLADSIELLFISRVFTGIFGATIPTAMAYMADISKPEDRAKSMGLIGAAFGLGFIIGPAVGGLLSGAYGYRTPLLSAAVFSFLALILAFFMLKETVDLSSAKKTDLRRFSLMNLVRAIGHPNLGLLFVLYFLASLAFAKMEMSFALFTEVRYGLDSTEVGYFFTYIGIISAVTQGILIRPLVKRFGEIRLIIFATFLIGTSYFVFAATNDLMVGIIATGLMALGIGLNNPSTTGLVSRNTDSTDQGGILGIQQSFSAFARILGPPMAGFAFDAFGPGVPFFMAGVLMVFAFVLSLVLWRKLGANGG
jgi:DHA1 family tetracycline resistance protein-like MFS transporter